MHVNFAHLIGNITLAIYAVLISYVTVRILLQWRDLKSKGF